MCAIAARCRSNSAREFAGDAQRCTAVGSMAYHGSGVTSSGGLVGKGAEGDSDAGATGGAVSVDNAALARIDVAVEAPIEGRELMFCTLFLPVPLTTLLLPFELLPDEDDDDDGGGGDKAVDASQSASGRVAITAAHWRSERPPARLPAAAERCRCGAAGWW